MSFKGYMPSLRRGRAVLRWVSCKQEYSFSREDFALGYKKRKSWGWRMQCHAVLVVTVHMRYGSDSPQYHGENSCEFQWKFNHLFPCSTLTFFRPASFVVGKIWTFHHLKQRPGTCFFPPSSKQSSMATRPCFLHFKVTVERVYTCYST